MFDRYNFDPGKKANPVLDGTEQPTEDDWRTMRASLEGMSGRINGALADLDWVPIRYVNQNYPREVLAGAHPDSATPLPPTPRRAPRRASSRC